MNKRKYLNRYLYPIIALGLGVSASSFLPMGNDTVMNIKFSGLFLAIHSFIYIVIITLLQFVIKSNNYLIPTCIFIVVNLLHAQFKIEHYPGQMEIRIIGNSIAALSFLLGHYLERKKDDKK